MPWDVIFRDIIKKGQSRFNDRVLWESKRSKNNNICLKARAPEQTVDLKTEPSNSGGVVLRENSEGQGNRARCRPWGRQESGMSQRLSNNNNRFALERLNLTAMYSL